MIRIVRCNKTINTANNYPMIAGLVFSKDVAIKVKQDTSNRRIVKSTEWSVPESVYAPDERRPKLNETRGER